jgi:hypothetical protein
VRQTKARQSVLERDYQRFWKFRRLVVSASISAWDADRAHDIAIISRSGVAEAKAKRDRTEKRFASLRAAMEREFPGKLRLILRRS